MTNLGAIEGGSSCPCSGGCRCAGPAFPAIGQAFAGSTSGALQPDVCPWLATGRLSSLIGYVGYAVWACGVDLDEDG